MHRELFHARLVAKNRTARHTATRVYRQHCHAVALVNQIQTQRFNKSALAHPWHTADAKPKRIARMGQQRGEQFISLRAVVWAGGLE